MQPKTDEHEPHDAAGYLDRGSAFLDTRQLSSAAADFEKALALDPTSPQAHNGLACVLLLRGELAAALAASDEAIRLDVDYAKGYAVRGRVRFQQGDRRRALDDFDKAIELDSTLPQAYHGRAECLCSMQRFEEAIADLSQVLVTSPDDGQTLAWRGWSYHFAGDYEAAIADLSLAIDQGAKEPWVFDVRGCAQLSIEQSAEAIEDFTRAIDCDASYASAYSNRGRAFLDSEEYEDAIADFDEAIRLGHDAVEANYYRGLSRYEQGKYEQAEAALTEAIALNPRYDWAYELRARVWEELGNEEGAEADRDKADELKGKRKHTNMQPRKITTEKLLEQHFAPASLQDISVTERRFPARVRADLQRAIDKLLLSELEVLHFCGVRKQHNHEGLNFSELLIADKHDPALSVPPQCEEVDIGEDKPVTCLKDGLWLLSDGGTKFAAFLEPEGYYARHRGIRFQVAAINEEAGTQACQRFFRSLEQAVAESECYRGKILSLEQHEDYRGTASGIMVHKLRSVEREHVILPRKTLELLERNVVRFVQQRPRLRELGLATKKGLLFYGPPGTGKTHTVHYLAGMLPDHTTLLISAEQVGLLDQYMTLARLLQPAMIVMEDVDLIARDRTDMQSVCEEVLLNKLLNEMDGLKQEADVMFVLTTNRPQALEAALASRPGRVDQAIEFPLPDEEGRAKLIRLYASRVVVPDEVVHQTVKKTENVSASFIKELLRRATQFHLERDDSGQLSLDDINNALDELLFAGGSLNRKLLGGDAGEER